MNWFLSAIVLLLAVGFAFGDSEVSLYPEAIVKQHNILSEKAEKEFLNKKKEITDQAIQKLTEWKNRFERQGTRSGFERADEIQEQILSITHVGENSLDGMYSVRFFEQNKIITHNISIRGKKAYWHSRDVTKKVVHEGILDNNVAKWKGQDKEDRIYFAGSEIYVEHWSSQYKDRPVWVGKATRTQVVSRRAGTGIFTFKGDK